jgi:hypothetical protein
LTSSQGYQSPRRETGGGLFDLDFLNWTAAAMRDATSSLHAL